jgi:hypothetical protein
VALEPLKELLTYLADQWKQRDEHEAVLVEESRRNRDALKRWSSDHANETLFQPPEVEAESISVRVEAQRQADMDLARTRDQARLVIADARRQAQEILAGAREVAQAGLASIPDPNPPGAVDELAGTIADRVRLLDAERREHEQRVAELRADLTAIRDQAAAGLEHLPDVPASEAEVA